jgi:hypothetical protein
MVRRSDRDLSERIDRIGSPDEAFIPSLDGI